MSRNAPYWVPFLQTGVPLSLKTNMKPMLSGPSSPRACQGRWQRRSWDCTNIPASERLTALAYQEDCVCLTSPPATHSLLHSLACLPQKLLTQASGWRLGEVEGESTPKWNSSPVRLRTAPLAPLCRGLQKAGGGRRDGSRPQSMCGPLTKM